MSDIYDYVYAHTMRQQNKDAEQLSAYSISQEDFNICDGEVNTSNFSPQDLQMFVDSLEIIARLEQAKQGQQHKRDPHKKPSRKRQVTCLDSSTCSSIHDEEEGDHDAHSSVSDSSSYSTENLYDEDYFGLPVQGQSTALYSNLNTDSSINSDSEDSGVFVIQHHQNVNPIPNATSHLYENIPALRSRSKMFSYSKSKSLKSRLLALIMKKQYVVKPQLPTMDVLSSTTIGEQCQESEIYDRVMDEVLEKQQQKLNKKSSKPKKSKSSASRAEHKFLEKAMRLLTL